MSMIPRKISLCKMILIGLLLIFFCGCLFQVASAYNASYNVTPIANSQLTITQANLTRGANITVMRLASVPSGTVAAALTATTLVVGTTKVATVGLPTRNISNISTIARASLTFPLRLPLNATVTNASLVLYLSSKTVTFGTPDLVVGGWDNFAPIDSTNQVVGDWTRWYTTGTPTIYNQTPVTFQSWTAATTKVIYLNDAAEAAITAANNPKNGGNFTISLRDEWDVTNNNRSMIWTGLTAQSAIYTLGSMQSVARSQDPWLNITYSLPDSNITPPPPYVPVANFIANITAGYSPVTIQFFDNSTNTSTAWKWDLVAGGTGVDDTAQNPIHTYAGAGVYSINLTASNSAGSDSEVKVNYITILEATPAPTPCPTGTGGGSGGSGSNGTSTCSASSSVQTEDVDPVFLVGIGLVVLLVATVILVSKRHG
jgi:PKD repeat protein